MASADCAAAGGRPMKSCPRWGCPIYMAPAGTESENGESLPDLTDEAVDPSPSETAPLSDSTGAAWTLLVATMFLAGL